VNLWNLKVVSCILLLLKQCNHLWNSPAKTCSNSYHTSYCHPLYYWRKSFLKIQTFLLFKRFNCQPSLCSWSFLQLVIGIFPTSNSINSYIWLCEMEFILSSIVISHMLITIVLKKNDQFPNMINHSHNELIEMPKHHVCSYWLFLWHISLGLLCRILFILQFITWPFRRRVTFWKKTHFLRLMIFQQNYPI
jgi:hypothetical protein